MTQIKEVLQNDLAVALITALTIWVASRIRLWIKARVQVETPDTRAIKGLTETLKDIAARVNILIECKGPELDLLVALGENRTDAIDSALGPVQEKARMFKDFKDKAACIDVGVNDA